MQPRDRSTSETKKIMESLDERTRMKLLGGGLENAAEIGNISHVSAGTNTNNFYIFQGNKTYAPVMIR